MKKRTKKILILASLFLLTILAGVIYVKWISPTRIGFINYPDYMFAKFDSVNDNNFIKVERINWKKGEKADLEDYGAVYIFGMGLRLPAERMQALQKAIKNGLAVYVNAATSKENNITSIAGKELGYVKKCLNNRSKTNFKYLLNYTRRIIDGKKLFSKTVQEPLSIPHDGFFHIGENALFETLQKYKKYREEKKLDYPYRPKVCFLTSTAGPSSEHITAIVQAFEDAKINIYPVFGFRKRLNFIRQVSPDMVVLMPHGRFTTRKENEVINYLKKRNIPLVCPINVYEPYSKWLKDQRGMAGGIMSQSVTMPELDGGIMPFVLSAQFKNDKGLYVFKSLPKRLKRFVNTVTNYLELQRKDNKDKKLVIIYYKGPGKNALAAAGLEVVPSLFNTLKKLKKAGYDIGDLPASPVELEKQIQENASVFNPYAKGRIKNFVSNSSRLLVPVTDYLEWVKDALPADLYAEVEQRYGAAPGPYMSVRKNSVDNIVLSSLRFGNVVLMPQTLPAYGDDTNKLIHGAKQAPPHPYIATYLWAKYGFEADAIMHFGTHGSFEFTPWKQVALSSYDWADVLIGDMPHFYIYTINNIGEAVIAKRRGYATLISHLTPPFMSSDLYDDLAAIHDKIHAYMNAGNNKLLQNEYRKSILELVKKKKINRELGLNELQDFDEDSLRKLHNYIHELESAKVNRGLYVLDRKYSDSEAEETARLMAVDTIAVSLADIDIIKNKITLEQKDNAHYFNKYYLEPAHKKIDRLFKGEKIENFFTEKDLNIIKNLKDKKSVKYTDFELALKAVFETMQNVLQYKQVLLASTSAEMAGVFNALNGGYISPSAGADPIKNPNSIPTGRNMFSIDAESTPTKEAWETAVKLGDELIKTTLKNKGEYPRKVAFSLWGGEFIRSHGTNVAEILYMLGVKPVWSSRGRVKDVKLIPIDELKRPRIDVLVQTSGQFRGAATSRLYLIDKAVRLAATAEDGDKYTNNVQQGTIDAEKIMISKGYSPIEARKLATARIFGAVNGKFGTGIMGLVESGDKWDDDQIVADQYIQNMGAIYTRDNWCEYKAGAFEAAMQNTDTVVQPRSSNTWGPLSLDHVYEFMGGMNLAVKKVTGNNPQTFFNDLRNPNSARIQSAKEAAMVEARTTVLNPKYIKEMMQEGASAAESFAEVARNSYGWEVMRPEMLEDYYWQDVKATIIDDKYKLGTQEFFTKKNPYALQEMTGVMLETIRKGYWKADVKTQKELAQLHAKLVEKYDAGCSGFVCGNKKLSEMVSKLINDKKLQQQYQRKLTKVRTASVSDKNKEAIKGMELKKVRPKKTKVQELLKENAPALIVIAVIILLLVLAVAFGSRKSSI